MKTLAAAVLISVAIAAPAAAKDRPPIKAEHAAIKEKLQSLGYTSWDEIKLDDDRPYHEPKWEVDDARKGDGPRYDIDLEPQTLRVIQEERDD